MASMEKIELEGGMPEGAAPPPADGRLLLQLRSDRRLGHEWDDWDGGPLSNGGSFESGSSLFFVTAAAAGASVTAALGLATWLAAPRLEGFSVAAPRYVGWGLVAGAILWAVWLVALAVALRARRNVLPPRLAEAGLLPWMMPKLERVGRVLGISRDRLGNSMLRVFNGLAAMRGRGAIAAEDLLILLPRCLGKEAMQSALAVSARYGVPIFVASRGRYARQMIELRRPKAIVAVACERDLVSGVHDVAGRLPVLGTTLRLADGPCRNTDLEVDALEGQVRQMLGLSGRK